MPSGPTSKPVQSYKLYDTRGGGWVKPKAKPKPAKPNRAEQARNIQAAADKYKACHRDLGLSREQQEADKASARNGLFPHKYLTANPGAQQAYVNNLVKITAKRYRNAGSSGSSTASEHPEFSE